MPINILDTVGKVASASYSKKMADRAQKNFESQLAVKKDIAEKQKQYRDEKIKLEREKLEETKRSNLAKEELELYGKKTERKEANIKANAERRKTKESEIKIEKYESKNKKEGELNG